MEYICVCYMYAGRLVSGYFTLGEHLKLRSSEIFHSLSFKTYQGVQRRVVLGVSFFCTFFEFLLCFF